MKVGEREREKEREREQIDDESISLVCTPRRPPVKTDISITFDRFYKIYVCLSASNFRSRSLHNLIFVSLLFLGFGVRHAPVAIESGKQHHSTIVKTVILLDTISFKLKQRHLISFDF